MVAMLVPQRFRCALTYRDHQIDVGKTMLRVMELFQENEFAIELGGQTYSLSYEINLARQEELMTQLAAPTKARTERKRHQQDTA
eukprot:9476990-Pyramimonas_sp.AAC.1